MAEPTTGNELADSRYFVVCLRILVNAQGRLVYIEVINDENNLHGRFTGWTQLTDAIQAWLTSQR